MVQGLKIFLLLLSLRLRIYKWFKLGKSVNSKLYDSFIARHYAMLDIQARRHADIKQRYTESMIEESANNMIFSHQHSLRKKKHV